jgi:DHA2 family multidrug resistance protein
MMRIAAVYFVLFIQFLDGSIVTIGLGAMARDLQVEVALTQWIVTSYGLGLVLAIPLGVRLTRGAPPFLILTWGMAMFFIASLGCALAPDLAVITVARFAQGVASGCTVLVGQRLLIELLGEERKAYALTLWSSAVSIAPVVGPVAGALLVDLASWRWMFFVNLPLLMLAGVALWQDLLWKAPLGALKLGLTQIAILAAVEIFAQLLMAQVTNPGQQQLIEVSSKNLVLGIVLGMGTFLAVGETTKDYVFKWPLLCDARFSLCTLVLAFTNGLLLVSAIVLPLWLQEVRHFPLLLVAYVLGASGVVCGVLSPVIGRRLPHRFFAVTSCVSLLMITISFAMSGTWQLASSLGDIFAPRLLLGLALALFAVVGPLSIMHFSGEQLSEANALSLFVRVFMSNLAVSVFIGGYDRLSHLLNALAIANAWARGDSPSTAMADLNAAVMILVLKIGSVLTAAIFGVLSLMMVLLFLRRTQNAASPA